MRTTMPAREIFGPKVNIAAQTSFVILSINGPFVFSYFWLEFTFKPTVCRQLKFQKVMSTKSKLNLFLNIFFSDQIFRINESLLNFTNR